MKKPFVITDQKIISKIFLIRGKKVMLDRDLAALYNVETRVLNQAVKRNLSRFPADFMFQLTSREMENWISQFVISNKEKKGLRKLPLAFTEEGVAMLSGVLNSEIAIDVNIQIIRIFIKMRKILVANKDILLKLQKLEKMIFKQDNRLKKHDSDIQVIFEALKKLVNRPPAPVKKIGYKRSSEKE
ncbi:MAG: ORF6N domain-containing protein [Bacteroidota bacterium]